MPPGAPDSAPLPVICLAGPTGSGKTAAALALAAALDGEVITADSRQVYADFPCITAQPTATEQAQCPHYLYGFLPTTQKISAGRWAAAASRTVAQILARGRAPLLVGGTGLYFQALLRGMARIPQVDPALTAGLEARLAEEGAPALHAALAKLDPAYAARIHPNDRQRIVRALEVCQATGRPFSWWHAHAMEAPLCAGPLLVLDAPLDWLEPRLARRLDAMLAAGALDEARAALARCADPQAPGWTGIGCAEALAHLQGRLTLAQCRERWLHNTRAYAKRQRTWFRARAEAVPLPPDDVGAVVAAARRCWEKSHNCTRP
jgi:tRNA dimethylallyltransferase